MGLDMNLEGRKYIGYDKDKDALGKLLQNMHGIKHKISSITVDLAYWRKFNALHSAFQENETLEEGSDKIYIDEDFFKSILKKMKAVQKDHSQAEELFPTQSGFFYGDTSYDDWYFQAIDESIKIFEKLLSEKIFESYDIYYTASW